MHLRRALLLFAIVIGLAALAAAVTRPSERRGPTSAVAPHSGLAGHKPRPTVELEFDATKPRRERRLARGRRATVTVDVPRSGQVDIPGLGLSDSAEPLTPAEFDVLAPRDGRYVLRYTPAGAAPAARAGLLVVSG